MTHSTGNTETLEILKKATQKDVHEIGLERFGRNETHMEEVDIKAVDQKVLHKSNLTQSEPEESKLREESKPLEVVANDKEETSDEF